MPNKKAGEAIVSSARSILFQRLYKDNPRRLAKLQRVRSDYLLGLRIRELREEAGLSQAALARLIGTQPSAISRIEDADYAGHSVETLRKIARALHKQLIIDFAPEQPTKPLQPT